MSDIANEDFSQGQILLASVANAGLQTVVDAAVSGYLSGLEEALTTVLQAADGLVGDGFELADFATLLRGEEV